MESLHLPVGGDRFRPCLEDVIEFLVVECRFDCQGGWRAPSEAGRERWRRMQTRTAVRDSPSEAAAALRSLGYTVAAPETANGPQAVTDSSPRAGTCGSPLHPYSLPGVNGVVGHAAHS